MVNRSLIEWLLDSDPAIRWQILRDILEEDEEQVARERQKIPTQGWGCCLLSFQDENGIWGGQLYNNKWLSTTYTMLLLRQFGLKKTIHKPAWHAKHCWMEAAKKEAGSVSQKRWMALIMALKP